MSGCRHLRISGVFPFSPVAVGMSGLEVIESVETALVATAGHGLATPAYIEDGKHLGDDVLNVSALVVSSPRHIVRSDRRPVHIRSGAPCDDGRDPSVRWRQVRPIPNANAELCPPSRQP